MKRNFLKKAVGIISVFAVALGTAAAPAVYAEEAYAENEMVFDSLEEYIEASAPRHLYAQGFGF